MAFYILGLQYADLHFSGIYFLHSHAWQKGIPCLTLNFMALLSYQLSMSTTVQLLIMYLCVMKMSRGQTSNIYYKLLISCILFWILLSVICLAVTLFGTESLGDHCSIYSSSSQVTQSDVYTISSFLICNNILAVSLVCLCFNLMKMINSSRESVTKQGHISGRAGGMKSYKLVLLLVSPSLTSWFLLQITVLLQIFADYHSKKYSSWLALILLPMNSALNPLVHTIRNVRFVKLPRKDQTK